MINLFDPMGGKAGAPADASGAQSQSQAPGLNHALPAQTQALLSAASMSHALAPLAAAQLGALFPQMAALQQASTPAVAHPSAAEQMAALLGTGGLAAAHLQQQLALQPEAAAVQHLLASAMAANQQQQPSHAAASSPKGDEDAPSAKASKPSPKAKRVPPKKRSPTSKAPATTTSSAASKPAKKKKASPPPPADESGDLDPDMSNWSVERLEQHVALLEQLNRPVPFTLKLLVGNAKRKEEKKQAKRIANRKFAHISRTRKKAFVQEITQQNDMLKRHAKILSLLPDVVLVIGANGGITFCSDRAERVLRYDMEELTGVNISSLLSPSSKEKMDTLIQRLLVTESLASEDGAAGTKDEEPDKANEVSDDMKPAVDDTKEAAISQSSANDDVSMEKVKLPPVPAGKDGFPLSVVKVTSKAATEGKKSTEVGAIEDSGYSSLSTNDSPTNNNETTTSAGRRQPVAPTCNICLLRKDRKEIWCEATLTVIANNSEPEPVDKKGSAKSISAKSKQSSKQATTQMTASSEIAEAQKELLLSIRPFRSSKKRSKTSRSRSQKQKNRSQKRRAAAHHDDHASNKRARQENVVTSEDTEGPEREQTISPDSEASEASKAHEDVAKSLLMMHERCSSDSSN